jgi:hypothetical protein
MEVGFAAAIYTGGVVRYIKDTKPNQRLPVWAADRKL